MPGSFEKLSISLESELARFVRDKAEEDGLSVSAYIAERLMREFRTRQLGSWLDEEGVPKPSPLESKRIELEFAKADLVSSEAEVARIEQELRKLESKRPSPRGAAPRKKTARRRSAA
jgi:hypothetical protein